MFEFGSGGSTLWLSDRGATVTSVEHSEEWFHAILPTLQEHADLLWIPATPTGTIRSSKDGLCYDAYVKSITRFPTETFDLVVIDGRARVDCVRYSQDRIKPGGMLLLDDSARKRYASVHISLRDWSSLTLSGPKLGQSYARSTIWTKPCD